MMDAANIDDRLLHGIVLAAGDGQRLQLYVQETRGEPVPKQYVNLIGRSSMLEHTFHRAEKLISAKQILTVVSRRHLLRARRLSATCQPPQRNSCRAARQQGDRTGDSASADVYL
jgi:mannose-1-phosphate guanylyltransferase